MIIDEIHQTIVSIQAEILQILVDTVSIIHRMKVKRRFTGIRPAILNLGPRVGAGQVGQDLARKGSLTTLRGVPTHLSRPLVSRNGKRARRRGKIVARFIRIEPASSRPYPCWMSN